VSGYGGLAADDPQGQRRIVVFVQALQQSGWTEGRNVHIDIRRSAGDAEHMRNSTTLTWMFSFAQAVA
jgi:hypothetical protein